MADSRRMSEPSQPVLTGVFVDADGAVHLSHATPEGAREATAAKPFKPYAWTRDGEGEPLQGDGVLTRLRRFENPADFDAAAKESARSEGWEILKPLEHQWLLENRARLFDGLHFDQLRRLQLDIETHCSVEGGFPDPGRKEDRVLAIGLRLNGEDHTLVLEAMTDEAERTLLKSLNAALADLDPDVIEGHNLFKFDLDYLKRRCRRFKVPCAWGRFGQEAKFRNSRLRIAERWIDYPRCDLPGRTVFDTYLAIQLYDITTRELPSYTLKDVAVHLGVTTEADNRTYLAPADIQRTYFEDRPRFLAYLGDDLRETAGIAALLLPTYVAQATNFPMTLQEICLRGTAAKVDSLFLEKYFHARAALPAPPEVSGYAGGFTKSFQEGVFRHVLHYDVASLYPSLLLHIGRNPAGDSLGVFIPMLTELREERLRYKQRAREAESDTLRREFSARQAAYKIVINSFYGYLGFGGARFADGELAAEVTAKGRELLQKLISEFERLGCTVLEADTDGIYVSSEKDWEAPEGLLDKVKKVLPPGIDLEFDGRYEAMFCYKAKNYALYGDGHINIAGSALRSRGIEPFLKELTDALIHYLLGASETNPLELEKTMREEIAKGAFPVERLAKSEYLSQSPEAYKRAVEGGKKPRRASLEVALRLEPQPGMGEQVSYYLGLGDKKRAPDWQVARPLAEFDASKAPYNVEAYLKKLDDWRKRYDAFLEGDPQAEQTELF